MESNERRRMNIIYPGTFDPVTFGHIDIIRRALNIFDHIEIAVVARSSKILCFSIEERVNLMKMSMLETGIDRVSVTSFDSLLVDYMKKTDCRTFIRGLRANSDFEYEFQMQLLNRRLAPEISGLYLMPSEENMYLSSTIVREIARFGGDLSTIVTVCVREALEKRFDTSAESNSDDWMH